MEGSENHEKTRVLNSAGPVEGGGAVQKQSFTGQREPWADALTGKNDPRYLPKWRQDGHLRPILAHFGPSWPQLGPKLSPSWPKLPTKGVSQRGPKFAKTASKSLFSQEGLQADPFLTLILHGFGLDFLAFRAYFQRRLPKLTGAAVPAIGVLDIIVTYDPSLQELPDPSRPRFVKFSGPFFKGFR